MKLNKKILLIFAAVLFSIATQAQQIPLYSNYFFTPFIYNPARSGTSGYTELTILHRRQWTGIQGSPETSALAINGSLNEQKVGWSAYGFADQTDIVKRLGLYGNYAYHINLSDNTVLSFGLGAGYLNNSIDVNNIRAREQGDVFTITNGDRGTFDVNAGINLKIANFQIGGSALQLVGQSIKYTEEPNTKVSYTLLRHYTATAQYDFKFDGDKTILSPLVMVRAAENVPIQVDAGLLLNLTRYGYIGAMYRSEYAVTGNIGINLTEQLTVGYAYDFSLNDYGSQLGTSHEFMLMYKFGNNRKNERLENEVKKLKQQQREQQKKVEETIDEKLEEFKDKQQREMKAKIDSAANQVSQQAAQNVQNQTPANTTSNQQNANNRRDNQNQTQNNNQGNNANPVNNGQNNGGYNNANTASNVTPGSNGYYVVAGVFSNKNNADRLQRKLEGQGFDVRTFQDPGNFYYYVYLLKFDSYQEADQAKSSSLNGRYNGELWIKIVK